MSFITTFEMFSVIDSSLMFILVTAFVAEAFTIIGCEISIRLLAKGKYQGAVLAFFLALKSFFSGSIGILIGAVCFFGLLNKSSQKQYLSGAPEGLKNLLTKIGINYIDEK
jgi:hypothetical protein